MAQRVHALDGTRWSDIALDLCVSCFGGTYTPTEGQVKAARRDYARLREVHGNGSAASPKTSRAGVEAGATTRRVSPVSSGASTFDSVEDGISDDVAWTPAPDFVSADSRRDALRQYLGTTWAAQRVYVLAPAKTRTVAAVGDWHGNIDPAILAALIEAQADVYVIGGDTYDQAYASSWAPSTPGEAVRAHEQGFRQESANNRATLETLLDNTAGVVRVFLGNHDIRAWRAAYDALPAWVLFHWADPFQMLLDGLGERAAMVGHEVRWHFPDGHVQNTGHDDEFVYVCGDVLFSHMNFTGGATETGVSKIWRHWFPEWSRPLNLTHVRVIVHFHVHQRNLHSRAGGHMLLVEPGMGGSITAEAYKTGYNGKWRPGVQGFVVLRQYKDGDDWRTDLGSVEMIAPRVAAGK